MCKKNAQIKIPMFFYFCGASLFLETPQKRTPRLLKGTGRHFFDKIFAFLPFFLEMLALPSELLSMVCARLCLADRLNVRLVSRGMRDAARADAPLYLSPPEYSTRALEGPRFFERMCAGFGARAEQCTLRLRVRRDAAGTVNADLAFVLLLATTRPFGFGATTLELTGWGALTRASVAVLPNAIRALTRLTVARLTDVPLGRAESAAVLGALATATSLTALDVTHTRIHDADALVSTLGSLRALRSLGVSIPFESGSAECAAVARAVEGLPHLLELDLGHDSQLF
jgi:hypothetical protein